jgi:hypothetical protein
MKRGGAYTFGGGKGSRAGSGLSLDQDRPSRWLMRGERGYRSLSTISCSSW